MTERFPRYGLEVRLGVPERRLDAAVRDSIRGALLVALATTLFAVALSMAAARYSLRPLRRLHRAVERIAQNPAVRVHALPGEFGVVGQALNQLLDQSHSREAALRTTSEERRRSVESFQALSRANRLMARVGDEGTLLKELCELTVTLHLADEAWFVSAGANGRGIVLASHSRHGGPESAFQRQLAQQVGDLASSSPFRDAVRDNQACLIEDVERDALSASWVGIARAQGIKTAVAVPVRAADKVIGAVVMFSSQVGHFDAVRMEVLNQIAIDLTVALEARNAERMLLQAMRQVEQQEHRLQNIFDSVSDAIISINREHKVVIVNDAAMRVFGASRSEMVGRDIHDFVPPRFRLSHTAAVHAFASSGRQTARAANVREELVGLRANGEEFPMEASISLSDAAGDSEGALMTVVLRDISHQVELRALKKAQDFEREANRARADFFSRVSHELRTPLTAIDGLTRMVGSSASERLSEAERQHLSTARQAAEQMQSLIDDLLDATRLKAGTMSLNPEAVEWGVLLTSTVDIARPLAERASIVIMSMTDQADGWTGHVDKLRLRQVLLNILSNAVKYNRERGRVDVGVAVTTKRIDITVRDTGIGMSPEQLRSLFKPFNRLGLEQSAIAGAGIGLSLSRDLVEMMGGRIDVVSEVDRGTEFTISLPGPHVAPSGAPPSPEPDARRQAEPALCPQDVSGVVLYIEDSEVNTVLVEHLLSPWPGIRLVTETTVEGGYEAYVRLRPNLVLLDMNLGGVSGLLLLRQLKGQPVECECNVIVLSASNDADLVASAKALGAHDYWTKPFDFETFGASVAKLVYESQSRTED